MPEPVRAKTGVATDIINITWSATNGYGISPPADSSVKVSGTVQFITQKACWVWTWVGTTATDVFVNETGYYVVCTGNNSFTVNQPLDTVIAFEVTPTNAQQPAPPSRIAAVVKGSISITSMEGEKKEH